MHLRCISAGGEHSQLLLHLVQVLKFLFHCRDQNLHCTKMKFSLLNIHSASDLFTFTSHILHGKVHLLCSASFDDGSVVNDKPKDSFGHYFCFPNNYCVVLPRFNLLLKFNSNLNKKISLNN